MPTRHRAQQHTYLGQEYEESENMVPNISDSQKKEFKDAHNHSVHIGCDTFPNELMRFHFEATPIWKNIIKMQSPVQYGSDLLCRKQLKNNTL